LNAQAECLEIWQASSFYPSEEASSFWAWSEVRYGRHGKFKMAAKIFFSRNLPKHREMLKKVQKIPKFQQNMAAKLKMAAKIQNGRQKLSSGFHHFLRQFWSTFNGRFQIPISQAISYW
jgi:hypothetical protein